MSCPRPGEECNEFMCGNSVNMICMNKKNTLAYEIACKYMALTEIYNRNLTDLRSQYDQTGAFVANGINSSSNKYALELLTELRREYCIEPKDINKEIRNHNYYSAQKWIDEYERLWE